MEFKSNESRKPLHQETTTHGAPLSTSAPLPFSGGERLQRTSEFVAKRETDASNVPNLPPQSSSLGPFPPTSKMDDSSEKPSTSDLLESCSGAHLSLFRNEIKPLISLEFIESIDAAEQIFGSTVLLHLRNFLVLSDHPKQKRMREKAIDFVFNHLTRKQAENAHLLANYYIQHGSPNEKTVSDLRQDSISEKSKELLEKYLYKPTEDGKTSGIEFLSSHIRPDEVMVDLKTRFGSLYEDVIKELLPLTSEETAPKKVNVENENKENEEEEDTDEETKGSGRRRNRLNRDPPGPQNKVPSDAVACLLLRRLPLNKPTSESGEWFYHLLTVLQDNKLHHFLPELIVQDYKLVIDLYEAEKRAREAEEDEKMKVKDDDYIDDDAIQCGFRPQADFKEYLPELYKEIYIPDPVEIDLRVYQKELVEELNGKENDSERVEKNGIVCAPTGSGKTVVAGYLMLDHLERRRAAGEPARVALFVPKVPLVEQQEAALYMYMRTKYNLEGFSGKETSKSRAYHVLAQHLIVFTPQIFVNMLNSPKKSDHLNLSDFTMLVFDECHHCDGNHPYKTIMDMVHDYEGDKPRIIGLTASVGVGRSRMVDKAVDHILKLCVHLNAEKIASVQKNKSDLMAQVNTPEDDMIRVDPYRKSPFYQKLVDLVRLWHMDLKQLIEKSRIRVELLKEFREPDFRNMDPYLTCLGALKNLILKVAGLEQKVDFVKTIDVQKGYVMALEYTDLLPNKVAHDRLLKVHAGMADEENAANDYVQRFAIELVKELEPLVDENCAENKQILKTLHDIIKQQFEQQPESRAIVFVQKRVVAEELAKHLNDSCSKLFGNRHSVNYITSSNQSITDGGQTASVQRETLDNFNHGAVKVLVATSVVEEGIDVRACNLIIKYNTTGSGTTHIQRKGRGRAIGSKAYLLALRDLTETREMIAMQEAILMEQCLKHLKSHGEAALCRRIAEKKSEVNADRENEKEQQKLREEQLKTKLFNLVCNKCEAVICKSSSMRKYTEGTSNHAEYIVCDPELWGRVTIIPAASPSTHHGAINVGEYRCGNCQSTFGSLLFWGILLVPLRISSTLLYDVHQSNSANQIIESAQCKTWSDVTRSKFAIPNVRPSELQKIYRSFLKYNAKLVNEIDRLAEEGRITQVRKELEGAQKYKQKRIREEKEKRWMMKNIDALDAAEFEG
ncbi:hypothetical protein L596_023842 [Steinernema carpocapsae]|uniref:RNA helicase n=1 Tax=Steinernema carpocapsae TaxID=34508 RepID=A0A4U5MEW6_STECR|nr:hypothetical protein L596_023842 [Steinernema carpocapsae]